MRTSAAAERSIKRSLLHIAAAVLLFTLINGCSSSSPVTEPEEVQPEERPTVQPKRTASADAASSSAVKKQDSIPSVQPKRKNTNGTAQRFSMQADTVDVMQRKRSGAKTPSVSVKASAPQRFYTVEVGAFRLKSNVERHRTQLGDRFRKPVRVLYDSTLKLTRVCVGTFSSRSQAVAFIAAMQKQFPGEYADCWVSYWTK